MSPNAERLLEAALALPNDDRFELAEALSASLMSYDHPPFDVAWREIIKRRSEEVLSGKVKTVTWDEVKRQAREELGG